MRKFTHAVPKKFILSSFDCDIVVGEPPSPNQRDRMQNRLTNNQPNNYLICNATIIEKMFENNEDKKKTEVESFTRMAQQVILRSAIMYIAVMTKPKLVHLIDGQRYVFA